MSGSERKFDVPSQWLTRFKQRPGIRGIGIHGDKLSCDEQAAEEFNTKFEQLLQKEKISYRQLYSADESGLLWKCLPKRTLAFESEQHAPEYKSSKERLNIMTCSNATRSQKLKFGSDWEIKKSRDFLKGQEL